MLTYVKVLLYPSHFTCVHPTLTFIIHNLNVRMKLSIHHTAHTYLHTNIHTESHV